MDNSGHIVAQRDDAKLKTHLDARIGALLDDVADHKGHDALGLVILDDLGHILTVFRLAEHDGHTGNVARDQRHAEAADDGVGNKADAGHARFLVRCLRLNELESFQNFRADRSGKARVQRLAEILLVGDEALEDADARRQVAQRLDLHTGRGIDGGEEICGIRESELFLCAIFGNRIIDCAFGQSGNGMRAAINQIR